MIIIKDFSEQSLEEANKLVAILRDNTQLLIVNGVNVEAKNVAYIQFKKGPCESCLIAILAAGITLEVEVEAWFVFISPMVNVWSSGLEGEAELKKAEFNRQIAVREAEAKKLAAEQLAGAEANRIIGDSLKGNEDYLRYLWIHSLEDTKDQIIYVPTVLFVRLD